MPFVSAICPNCGGTLAVDSKNEAAVCQYCNTPFIVEKAVNQYNYNIQNAQVHIHDEYSTENKLKSAETLWTKHHDYKAYELFEKVSSIVPDDYRPWWGMARIQSDDFSRMNVKLNKVMENATRAIRVAPENKREELAEIWNDYQKRYDENEKLEYEREIQRKEELQEELQQQEQEHRVALSEVVDLNDSCDRLIKWSKVFLGIIIVLAIELSVYFDPQIAGLTVFLSVILVILIAQYFRKNERRRMLKKREEMLGKKLELLEVECRKEGIYK